MVLMVLGGQEGLMGLTGLFVLEALGLVVLPLRVE
jgi:hypothetical protein